MLHHNKNKLKMCKDLNGKKESFKILEESTSNKLFDLGHNNFFLDMSPDARETKPNMNHWYLIRKKKKLLHRQRNNQQN